MVIEDLTSKSCMIFIERNNTIKWRDNGALKGHLNGELRILYNAPTLVKYKNTVKVNVYMNRLLYFIEIHF